MENFIPLVKIAESFAGLPVLVIGDIMLDRFVYGDVERISPESPVPVLSIKKEISMLGGGGNAFANLVGLGTRPYMIGVIGNDDAGQNLKDMISATGANTDGLITDKTRSTTLKTRYLCRHQQLLRTDHEDKAPLSKDIEEQILDAIQTQIKNVKAVLLSDYNKGVLTPNIIREIVKKAKTLGIPVIADPKGHDYTKYSGVDAITPNKKELHEATGGLPVNTDDNVEFAAQHIITTCNINTVIATRSAEGLSVVQKDFPPHHVRSQDIEVFDVSGAGDTVIAVIAAALAAGSSLPQAGELANIAGSIVVTKVGTAPIRIEEMLQSLRESDSALTNISDWDAAAENIKRWQARGLKVGFTNGCFDVLHVGHVSYLQDARKHCDRLVVGLNRDTSVKILKGETRPVHDEDSRAHVLAGLGAVDLVVLFGAEKVKDDNTACALLETLKPDIYFKGGDYRIEEIPEAPTVKACGGTVKIMPEYAGHSSTNSISRMAR